MNEYLELETTENNLLQNSISQNTKQEPSDDLLQEQSLIGINNLDQCLKNPNTIPTLQSATGEGESVTYHGKTLCLTQETYNALKAHAKTQLSDSPLLSLEDEENQLSAYDESVKKRIFDKASQLIKKSGVNAQYVRRLNNQLHLNLVDSQIVKVTSSNGYRVNINKADHHALLRELQTNDNKLQQINDTIVSTMSALSIAPTDDSNHLFRHDVFVARSNEICKELIDINQTVLVSTKDKGKTCSVRIHIEDYNNLEKAIIEEHKDLSEPKKRDELASKIFSAYEKSIKDFIQEDNLSNTEDSHFRMKYIKVNKDRFHLTFADNVVALTSSNETLYFDVDHHYTLQALRALSKETASLNHLAGSDIEITNDQIFMLLKQQLTQLAWLQKQEAILRGISSNYALVNEILKIFPSNTKAELAIALLAGGVGGGASSLTLPFISLFGKFSAAGITSIADFELSADYLILLEASVQSFTSLFMNAGINIPAVGNLLANEFRNIKAGQKPSGLKLSCAALAVFNSINGLAQVVQAYPDDIQPIYRLLTLNSLAVTVLTRTNFAFEFVDTWKNKLRLDKNFNGLRDMLFYLNKVEPYYEDTLKKLPTENPYTAYFATDDDGLTKNQKFYFELNHIVLLSKQATIDRKTLADKIAQLVEACDPAEKRNRFVPAERKQFVDRLMAAMLLYGECKNIPYDVDEWNNKSANPMSRAAQKVMQQLSLVAEFIGKGVLASGGVAISWLYYTLITYDYLRPSADTPEDKKPWLAKALEDIFEYFNIGNNAIFGLVLTIAAGSSTLSVFIYLVASLRLYDMLEQYSHRSLHKLFYEFNIKKDPSSLFTTLLKQCIRDPLYALTAIFLAYEGGVGAGDSLQQTQLFANFNADCEGISFGADAPCQNYTDFNGAQMALVATLVFYAGLVVNATLSIDKASAWLATGNSWFKQALRVGLLWNTYSEHDTINVARQWLRKIINAPISDEHLYSKNLADSWRSIKKELHVQGDSMASMKNMSVPAPTEKSSLLKVVKHEKPIFSQEVHQQTLARYTTSPQSDDVIPENPLYELS